MVAGQYHRLLKHQVPTLLLFIVCVCVFVRVR